MVPISWFDANNSSSYPLSMQDNSDCSRLLLFLHDLSEVYDFSAISPPIPFLHFIYPKALSSHQFYISKICIRTRLWDLDRQPAT